MCSVGLWNKLWSFFFFFLLYMCYSFIDVQDWITGKPRVIHFLGYWEIAYNGNFVLNGPCSKIFQRGVFLFEIGSNSKSLWIDPSGTFLTIFHCYPWAVNTFPILSLHILKYVLVQHYVIIISPSTPLQGKGLSHHRAHTHKKITISYFMCSSAIHCGQHKIASHLHTSSCVCIDRYIHGVGNKSSSHTRTNIKILLAGIVRANISAEYKVHTEQYLLYCSKQVGLQKKKKIKLHSCILHLAAAKQEGQPFSALSLSLCSVSAWRHETHKRPRGSNAPWIK